MLIRDFLSKLPFEQGVAATIGNFDGLHLGHQALIAHVQSKARALGLPVVVILFEPQPQEFFLKDKAPLRLMSFRAKYTKLMALGVDAVFCLQFNSKIAHLSATDFVQNILFKRLNVQYLCVGQDFCFGHQRTGNTHLLHTLFSHTNRKLELFEDYCNDTQRISSTQIRQLLESGQIEAANHLLGEPYTLCGRVIHGQKLGRTFGVPTANILLKNKNAPLRGVYCVKATLQNGTKARGLANIGFRPTISGLHYSLEVHLLEQGNDFYGQYFSVHFLHKIRNECKFKDFDMLVTQIYQDIQYAKEYWQLES